MNKRKTGSINILTTVINKRLKKREIYAKRILYIYYKYMREERKCITLRYITKL